MANESSEVKWINKTVKYFGELTKSLNKKGDSINDYQSRLAEENKYIRPASGGYRAVSLHSESPLCKYANNCVKTLEGVESHLELTLESGNINGREERKLQAYIIKNALENNRSMINTIGRKFPLGELYFVGDEIALGATKGKDKKYHPNSRSDIIAVAKKQNDIIPVLIELKYGHVKDPAIKQIEEYKIKLKNAALSRALCDLIKVTTGCKPNMEWIFIYCWISKDEGSSKKHEGDFHKNNIHFTDVIANNDNYEFRPYWIKES